jgi:hypothetical protein
LGPAEPGSQKMDSLMIQILFGHYFWFNKSSREVGP